MKGGYRMSNSEYIAEQLLRQRGWSSKDPARSEVEVYKFILDMRNLRAEMLLNG